MMKKASQIVMMIKMKTLTLTLIYLAETYTDKNFQENQITVHDKVSGGVN